ncbi:MAG: glycosyl hydrolase family 17 protein [Rubrivivax sp.]
MSSSRQEFFPPARRFGRFLVGAVLGVVVTLLLASCGGGSGNLPVTGVERRALSADFLQRQAVNYSPYRSTNRDTETISKAMLEQDLRLVVRAGFGLIRLFSSDDMVARQTLEVIRDQALDLKVQLGIWIGTDETANQADIARGIALAGQFPSIVASVSVGNEAMVSWSGHRVTVDRMLGYIRQVRSAVAQPVTTDDNWAFFAGTDGPDPRPIVEAIDYVAMHTYPLIDTKYALWEWRRSEVGDSVRALAMMDSALAKARKDHDAVRNYLRKIGHGAIPVVIGETGWKAEVADGEVFRAHPVNQKMYLDCLRAWAAEGGSTAPDKIFWFQAFDEPWKQGDDKWGLFDVNRRARYAVQSLFPQAEWTAERYVDADAVYHLPFTVGPTVTASRYTIQADVAVTGEAKPLNPLSTLAWAGGTAAAVPAGDAVEGAEVLRITPGPAAWGWGFAFALSTDGLVAEDLSGFEPQGALHLSIRTTYPGKLELGFMTGSSGDESAFLKLLSLDPASNAYGYANDGQWHTLRIPLAGLAGEKAFGMQVSTLDMARVTQPLVVADRYETTGKSAGFAGNSTPIDIDQVYWTRD